MVSIMNNQTNVSDKKEILQYAVDSGIINLESIKNVVDDMTKKEILAQHKYAIVQGSDGR